MKYTFTTLDKAIEKWITDAYSKSPNRKYAIDYLYKRFVLSINIYKENANKSILKIADKCYHHYSLGKYKEAQSVFFNDDRLCGYFNKEELEGYLNMKLIVNETKYKKQRNGQFTPPPKYKITDDKLKFEIYKACKNIIISKELLRKVKELPEYKLEEVVKTISVKPKITNEDAVDNISDEKETNVSEKEINIFCKEMPLSVPTKFFQIFNLKNSKNDGKPFLNKEQLDLFIRKAFKGEKGINKLKFNQAAKGEKLLIQFVFYKFYSKYCDEYFGTAQKQGIFINLLADNFIGWNSKSLSKKFKPDIKNKLFNEFDLILDNP